jgi:hypothetical protein
LSNEFVEQKSPYPMSQEMGGGKIKLFKVGKFWQCFGNVGPLNEKIKLNKGE